MGRKEFKFTVNDKRVRVFSQKFKSFFNSSHPIVYTFLDALKSFVLTEL